MKTKIAKMVLITLLCVINFSVIGLAADYKINIGIGYNDKSAQYKSLCFFKEIVETNSQSKIDVILYHSSQLGDDREMMEALQMGAQEMTCPSTAPVAQFINGFKVFDLPFLFPTYESADYVLDGPVGQQLLGALEKIGIIGLAYWENGYRQLTNKVRPVVSPKDVDGLKIRTMENPIHLAAWKTMGANPTPMAFGELFSAMQQGVVSGQENPWGTIYLQNFFEVQSFTTDTGHVYSPFVLMISKKFWDKLPKDLQAVVYDAAQKARLHNRKINRAMNAEFLETLKTKMKVTLLTPEQRQAFQNAVQPVYQKFSREIGEDFIQSVQAEVTTYQKWF